MHPTAPIVSWGTHATHCVCCFCSPKRPRRPRARRVAKMPKARGKSRHMSVTQKFSRNRSDGRTRMQNYPASHTAVHSDADYKSANSNLQYGCVHTRCKGICLRPVCGMHNQRSLFFCNNAFPCSSFLCKLRHTNPAQRCCLFLHPAAIRGSDAQVHSRAPIMDSGPAVCCDSSNKQLQLYQEQTTCFKTV